MRQTKRIDDRTRWLRPAVAEGGAASDWFEQMLALRGIGDPAAREEYLSASPQLTHDPMLMRDMEASVSRILQAVERAEPITVYGDYDADGVSAVSLLLETLNWLDADVDYYIPSRFDEGYGLNREALDLIAARGSRLVITVDCGSVSLDEVNHARAVGLDIIVTDHHNPGERMPDCLFLNPKRPDCAYPNRNLSGCGVAFKLAQALQRTSDRFERKRLAQLLDLVALATIGDIVPLTGENRTLVKYGMRTIRGGRRPGLAELIRRLGLSPEGVRSEQIAYLIVPHLNAGGRMSTADTGVRLLSGGDETAIAAMVDLLMENNQLRRQSQEEALRTVLDLAEQSVGEREPILLIAPPAGSIHEGIAGIVAGKLKDRYYRPAMILTETADGRLKGTGRSVPGVDLHALLNQAADLFEKFGGHAGACGFMLPKDRLPEFHRRVTQYMENWLQREPDSLTPRLAIDAVVSADAINPELMERLAVLEPFGKGNEKPVLCLDDILPEQCFCMGERKQHVRFRAGALECVLFQRADEFRHFSGGGERVSLAGYPEWNEWNGKRKIQFVVADFQCYNGDC